MKKLFIFLLALLPMTLMAQDNPVVKSLFEEPETRYLKMKQKEHLKALDNKFKKALKNGKQADGCYHVEKLCRGGDKLYKEEGVYFFGVPYREALEYAEHYNYKIMHKLHPDRYINGTDGRKPRWQIIRSCINFIYSWSLA